MLKRINLFILMKLLQKMEKMLLKFLKKIALYLYNEYKDISLSRSNTFGNISDDSVKIPDIQIEKTKKGCC